MRNNVGQEDGYGYSVTLAIYIHLFLNFSVVFYFKGGFLVFFFKCILFNTASYTAPLISLCQRRMGLNPGLFSST